MKRTIFFINLFLASGIINAQEKITYPHCNCTETINYSQTNSTILNGSYELTCNNIIIESGQYKEGAKDGTWITRNSKGNVIRHIGYSNGKLSGDYNLFSYDGNSILTAHFQNNLPIGDWSYMNSKGKIIKQGKYDNGKPVGVWTLFDKKGKKPMAEYDFDNNKYLSSNIKVYYTNNSILKDDQSGEYFILYYPERNINEKTQPFGGYLLANDYFAEYQNIPAIMMDTYTNYNYLVNIKFENYAVKDIIIEFNEKLDFNSTLPSLPFIVQTNPPAKIKRIRHSIATKHFLKEKIWETINLIGPWIVNDNTEVKIHVPFVLNEIKR